MIFVDCLGNFCDSQGNYLGHISNVWYWHPGISLYFQPVPQQLAIKEDAYSEQMRFYYKISPLNSLYVADFFSEMSVYIRHDAKTFLVCHPLGKILLMLNGKLQATFNLPHGQKRIIKMNHVLYFSGNHMSAYQPSLIYLMDSYGVKSCMYQFHRLDNMTTRCFYDKNLKLENGGTATEIRQLHNDNERCLIRLGEGVIVEMSMAQNENRLRLETQNLCISASYDMSGQGHMDITRYQKDCATIQKLCFNGKKLRVKQNQYSASISVKNELSLSNWSADHIPNQGEIFNRNTN